jgi:hypothetical protein
MNPGWRLVLQLDSPTRAECWRFADVSGIGPTHISIVAEETASGMVAERLFRRLLSAVSALTLRGATPGFCGGPRLLSCMARHEPSCQSLLVAVTGSHRISTGLRQLMRDWTLTRPQRSSVLPVLPAGVSPSAVLPHPLDRLIGLFINGPVESLAPDVLRAAGVGGGDFRAFVSYRRDDAADLAEQVHDELTRSGFQVFLDRFRGLPGQPFPRVLAEELADKGLVVVIESPLVRSSPWTLAEVGFARALRLGLLALAMPGGPQLRAIPAADRHTPSAGEWISAGAGGLRLRPSACSTAVDFIRQRYAQHVLYRRLYLENLLHRALASTPLSVAAVGQDAFHVSGGARDYVLHLASRPPRLRQVRNASSMAQPLGAHPVVIGAHRFLPPADRPDIEWLADQVSVSLRSESTLPRIAKSLAAGSVPP